MQSWDVIVGSSIVVLAMANVVASDVLQWRWMSFRMVHSRLSTRDFVAIFYSLMAWNEESRLTQTERYFGRFVHEIENTERRAGDHSPKHVANTRLVRIQSALRRPDIYRKDRPASTLTGLVQPTKTSSARNGLPSLRLWGWHKARGFSERVGLRPCATIQCLVYAHFREASDSQRRADH